MTPAQRQRVRDLFEQAVDLPDGPERLAWLAREAGDTLVADEVASLLGYHDRAGVFLTRPVLEGAQGLLDTSDRFDAGDALGAYRITRELGRGGMGVVYLATDTRLGRQVALKVLAPSLTNDPSQRERLRREARAAALLSHPGICMVYALEEIGEECVIASEYIDGSSLRDDIAKGHRPSGPELSQMLQALVSALAAAHARGITHRDLKPENVMRSTDGAIKILDFGLALTSDAAGSLGSPRVTSPGALIGTPAYMAPEQINHGAVDARTDMFALGVLAFEYATGVHPFDAASPMGIWARVLEGEPTSLRTLRSDLPHQVVLVIERCLRRIPADRFATARDLALALETSTHQSGVARTFWWRTHMLVLLLLYVLAAVTAWFVNDWQRGIAGVVFAALAMLATIGGVFRGHLLFAEREHDHATFRRELRRAAVPLTGVDLLMALGLVAEGLWVSPVRPVRGALISGLGLGLALARLVLERSTTTAAFGESRGDE
jgi:predicted Ser/Thr protein kinase